MKGGAKEREEGERGRKRERNKNLLFHVLMHYPLVDSYVCPDKGWNSRLWYIRMML